MAAYRFGHTMVRAFYDDNRNFGRKNGGNGVVQDFATFEQRLESRQPSVHNSTMRSNRGRVASPSALGRRARPVWVDLRILFPSSAAGDRVMDGVDVDEVVAGGLWEWLRASTGELRRLSVGEPAEPHVDTVNVPFSAGPARCPGRELVLFTTSTFLAGLLHGRDVQQLPPSRLHAGHPIPRGLDPFALRFALTSRRDQDR